MRRLNCLFIVQGEGRGHMTQALALGGLLRQAGHHVGGVLVGKSAQREAPEFFLRKIGVPVAYFESPNFSPGARQKSVRPAATLWHNGRLVRRFRHSLETIEAQVRLQRPDLIINFFEPLGGLYNGLYRPEAPMVCIGHQYMFHHPAFTAYPRGRLLDRAAARFFTRLTALGAARRLALSFYPAPALPEKRLAVVPPLLRNELFRQPTDRQEPFFLVYLLNRGYADDIIRWHGQNPGHRLHCFWDNREAAEVEAYDETLTFHRLNDEKFLSMMAGCSGLVSTAGFESVCEAMYLGKPVLLAPVEQHFEQHCNALDATGAGAGLWTKTFDIDQLVRFLPNYHRSPEPFRNWVRQAEERFLKEIEAAADAPVPAVLRSPELVLAGA